MGFLVLPAFLAAQEYKAPEDYYTDAAGLVGEPLKSALHDIIDDHIVIGYYDKIPLLFSVIDQDPGNEDNILLLYSDDSIPFTSNSWNREHSWPRSFGADEGPPFSDAHHLFPTDSTANTDRSNYPFDNIEGGVPMRDAPETMLDDARRLVEPHDADKGRIARAMFYMDTRYDDSNGTGDFVLTDFPNSFSTRFGRLSALLEWNRAFPPDEREKRRNHLIFKGVRAENSVIFQANRNPFVDYPDLVDAIYTADEVITWGSWRIGNFTFEDLDAGDIAGFLDDPDEDTLPNLLEFALQTGPLDAHNSRLPEVDRGEGINYLQFGRIPEPEKSFIEYAVEVSYNPLELDSWKPVAFTDRDLQIAPDGLAEFVSLSHFPEEDSRPAFYRLLVKRETPSSEPIVLSYDPAIDASGGHHLFTYTEAFDNGWHLSDWFGFLLPTEAPWFYHLDHKWMYSVSEDEKNVWIYDFAMGWYYTSIDIYPFLYSSTIKEWLLYVKGSDSPERWFYRPLSSSFIQEAELFNN